MESTHEKESKIVQKFIDESVNYLEDGEPVYVSGGYLRSGERAVLDNHCDTIVRHLSSKGYIFTTNHGNGCKDYRFIKQLNLV